ncbi:MAG: hypothetical protein HY784_02180 [Chloroflexi bacterium]|nr:hypothetical protein [Chloroflexota bacterium]
MLTGLDWLRRCQTGAELLATLLYLQAAPDADAGAAPLGPPHSALTGPCRRCWVYAPEQVAGHYCPVCRAVLRRAHHSGLISRNAVLVWGAVNRLPGQLETRQGFYRRDILGAYLHDEHHFLLMLNKRRLRAWIQELVLVHGADLTGLLQIFPTTGASARDSTGELLTRAAYQETHAAPDRLLVRFHAAPYHMVAPRHRERLGIMSFEVAEFLRLLEAARVFRTLLRPDEQEILRQIFTLEDAKEEGFYWGRLLGQLNPEARDMLDAWRVRSWPPERIRLFYELMNYIYVDLSQFA